MTADGGFWFEGFIDYATRPFRQAGMLDWLFWTVVLVFGAIGLWSTWCERRAGQGREAPAFWGLLSVSWRRGRTAFRRERSGTA